MIFIIQPQRGIGPISFGMTRAEVAAAMATIGGGLAHARGAETDCFFENSFQVSFEEAGKVDFIEVCSGIAVEVHFDGRNVFDLHADELVALIQKHEEADTDLSDPPDAFTFSKLILTLWGRDEQYDYKGPELKPVFATVGLGAPSYLAAIRAIRNRRSSVK